LASALQKGGITAFRIDFGGSGESEEREITIKAEIDDLLSAVKLLKMRLDEEITSEEYLLTKKQLLDERLSLKEKLDDREHSTDSWLELAEIFFDICLQARNIMESDNLEAKKSVGSISRLEPPFEG
jgi:hypothetical protein